MALHESLASTRRVESIEFVAIAHRGDVGALVTARAKRTIFPVHAGLRGLIDYAETSSSGHVGINIAVAQVEIVGQWEQNSFSILESFLGLLSSRSIGLLMDNIVPQLVDCGVPKRLQEWH
jgi:hypothetical protein